MRTIDEHYAIIRRVGKRTPPKASGHVGQARGGVAACATGSRFRAPRTFYCCYRSTPFASEVRLVRLAPARIRQLAWSLVANMDRGARVVCPVCQRGLRMFLPFGIGSKLRTGALCPGCLSLERDRAAWLLLTSAPHWLRKPMRMLHIAPERCLESRLREPLGSAYVTGDLMRPDVDRRFSVEALPFEDQSFDAIICNHVLEHVEDDRRALAELHRVLTPRGWAMLQVPIHLGRAVTIEDPSVTSPRERHRLFGQSDHVRWYGRDYGDRLRRAGFELELIEVRARYDAQEIKRYGLDPAEVLHICRKASPVP
jgi:SAM-dependent methyltransferase